MDFKVGEARNSFAVCTDRSIFSKYAVDDLETPDSFKNPAYLAEQERLYSANRTGEAILHSTEQIHSLSKFQLL